MHVGDLRYDKQRERIPQWEEALAAARLLGRGQAVGVCLNNLGGAYLQLGEVRPAQSWYAQGLAVARDIGDRTGEGAALSGLGDSQDFSAFDTLAEWTKRGKPRACRSSALQALARLARTTNPNEEQQKRVVQVVSACLDEQSPVVQFGAVGALGQLGKAASSAVPALNALASHHPMDGLRDSAKQAVKQIESNTPPPVEVTRLREELERLKKSQDDLQERLNRFEKTKPVSKEGQTK